MSDIERDIRHLKTALSSERVISSRLQQGILFDSVKTYLATSRYNQEEISRHTKRLKDLGLSQQQIDSALYTTF